MGYAMFFGCLFLAFGPAAAIFTLVIAKVPTLIILTIGGGFFWILSLFIASIWWYIIPPLRDIFVWTIFWSVLFQEAGRYLFYKLYTKAEKGFVKPQQTTALTTHPDNLAAALVDLTILRYYRHYNPISHPTHYKNTHYAALGLGTGITQTLITYTSILWQSTGPGGYFSPSCPNVSLFPMSAYYSLCFSLLHIFWSLVAFEGYKERSYPRIIGVAISHLVASLFTLINLSGGHCAGSAVMLSLCVGVNAVFAWLFAVRSPIMTGSGVRPFKVQVNNMTSTNETELTDR